MLEYDRQKEIVRYLASDSRVILAFLFGSFAKDRARSSSDLDIAVYLASPYLDQDVADIWNHLEDISHRDVDLIVLNDAPPGISWTAMRGRILVDKNPKLRLELMLAKSREAEDFREFQMDFLRERSRHWGKKHVQPISRADQ
ncbi:MAG: nucleotidyltransferase domain-containing protein [Firmicutes bacterium]|nr:nucleotidyltransferase domain-containing protein [Bacillota bacterium]